MPPVASARTWEGGRNVIAMARQEIIIDDLTGEPDAQPIHVALGAKAWTVDLASGSLAKLEAALAPFLVNAVPAKANKSKRVSVAAKAKPPAKDAAAVAERARIREWAAANDIALPARGRIPGAVLEQFAKAKRRKK